MATKNKRCRHERHSWIIGGHSEWCYVCGAYRGLEPVGPGQSKPRTHWIKPTGNPDDNPFYYIVHTGEAVTKKGNPDP